MSRFRGQLSLNSRSQMRQAHAESRDRIAAAQNATARVVATGVCPQCGTGLRRNLSMAGWWQCDALGEPSFRRPENRAKPACSWQGFTE